MKMLNARTSSTRKERAGFDRLAQLDRAQAERASREWSSFIVTSRKPLVGRRCGRAPSGRPRVRRHQTASTRAGPSDSDGSSDPDPSHHVAVAACPA